MDENEFISFKKILQRKDPTIPFKNLNFVIEANNEFYCSFDHIYFEYFIAKLNVEEL